MGWGAEEVQELGRAMAGELAGGPRAAKAGLCRGTSAAKRSSQKDRAEAGAGREHVRRAQTQTPQPPPPPTHPRPPRWAGSSRGSPAGRVGGVGLGHAGVEQQGERAGGQQAQTGRPAASPHPPQAVCLPAASTRARQHPPCPQHTQSDRRAAAPALSRQGRSRQACGWRGGQAALLTTHASSSRRRRRPSRHLRPCMHPSAVAARPETCSSAAAPPTHVVDALDQGGHRVDWVQALVGVGAARGVGLRRHLGRMGWGGDGSGVGWGPGHRPDRPPAPARAPSQPTPTPPPQQ